MKRGPAKSMGVLQVGQDLLEPARMLQDIAVVRISIIHHVGQSMHQDSLGRKQMQP